MPAGTTCSGGATGDKCLVSFKTAGNFGNCVVVQQAAAGGNATAGAAEAGTDGTAVASAASTAATATSTATTGTKGNNANNGQETAANTQAGKFKAFLDSLRQNSASKSVVRARSLYFVVIPY